MMRRVVRVRDRGHVSFWRMNRPLAALPHARKNPLDHAMSHAPAPTSWSSHEHKSCEKAPLELEGLVQGILGVSWNRTVN